MGLLDEAIKQHLELKRRRGADPGEIERLEQEALGPVRRLQQEAPAAGVLPAEADTAYDEDDYAEEPYDEHEAEDDEPDFTGPGTEPATESPSQLEHDRLGAHGVVPPAEDVLPEDLIEPEERRSTDPEDHLGVETVEYDVEAEHAREEERPRPGEGDRGREEGDMLEDTPEFFQDAPDHDRLWFEQRPPRDFDFEG